MRNQLVVAVANVEAFIDGKIKPTPDRLNSVLQFNPFAEVIYLLVAEAIVEIGSRSMSLPSRIANPVAARRILTTYK